MGFPEWDKIDAVLVGADNQIYFFRNKGNAGEFVKKGALTKIIETSSKWGKVSNDFLTNGLTAAVVHTNGNSKTLHIFSKKEHLTYKIGANGKIPTFSDQLNPETLSMSVNVAYTHEGKVYLFGGENDRFDYAKFNKNGIVNRNRIKRKLGQSA